MKDKIAEEFKKNSLDVKKRVLLKNYTTYKIGGPAKYFFVATDRDDLIKALEIAKAFGMPFFVIGGGSNMLFSDKGFSGLVVKISFSEFRKEGSKLITDAGFEMTKLASYAAEEGISGFEWMAGIPAGTVGGALFGHAQAFGYRMSDLLESVEVLNLKNFKIENLSKEQCKFALKNSVFKKNSNLVILSATFNVENGESQKVEEQMTNLLSYRRNSHPLDYPSAGSVFINPEKKIKNKKLLKDFPELANFNEKGIIPAGYLIDKAGLRGKKIGGAQISEKHANFIINVKNAKARDVIALIKLAQRKVKKIFGINLETEIRMVGFKSDIIK